MSEVMKQIPEELDWVTVRSACSLKEAFLALRAGVKNDLEHFNSQPQFSGGYQMDDADDSYYFSVGRSGNHIECTTFKREKDHVEISFSSGRSSTSFVAVPKFSDEGHCKWEYDGNDLEQWQIRKLALEALFFPAN